MKTVNEMYGYIYQKLKPEASENPKDEFGSFLKAVQNGNEKKIEEKLEINRSLLNKKDKDNHSAIYHTIEADDLTTTLFLLLKGASIETEKKVEEINNENNQTKQTIKKITLLEDESLEKSEEMKTLLLTFPTRKKNIDTLRHLEKQISEITHAIAQHTTCSIQALTRWQSFLTTYTAVLTAGSFYLRFYGEGGVLAALTVLYGAINYGFHIQSKTQPQYFEDVRQQMLTLVTELKPLFANQQNNNNNNQNNDFSIEELENKLQDPNLFLTITDALNGLRIIFSALRNKLENEVAIELEHTNAISDKFSNFDLFKNNSLVQPSFFEESCSTFWSKLPSISSIPSFFKNFGKTPLDQTTELTEVVVTTPTSPSPTATVQSN